MNLLVTGGYGFIGTNFIHTILDKTSHKVLNIDKISYAADENNHKKYLNNPNYSFLKCDICDEMFMKKIIFDYKPDYIMNFAAESHVDNSIKGSKEFMTSNFMGTFNLLEISRIYFESLDSMKQKNFKFHQISTDEVYGDLDKELFHEESHFKPSSPYSASKASADHLVNAWHRTYKLPTVITNCSNNFGPYQYPEKLIPVVIIKALQEKKIPVYGNGKQIRDWIYVDDHINALIQCLSKSQPGQTYNIGSANQINNLDLIKLICEELDKRHPRQSSLSYFDLVEFVNDRPGHDKEYGINNQKAIEQLFWTPKFNLNEGINMTLDWYLENKFWWQDKIKDE